MKNDDMRALVDEIRSANKAYKCVPNYMGDAAADAIETLLAREAEVLKAFDKAYLSSKSESASRSMLALYNDIRAILYPQPAAMAEEKTND